MKTKNKILTAIGVSIFAAFPLMAGLVVNVQVPAPAVVVQAPAPAPPPPAVVVTAVPDSYVWDGNEYVGVVGTQYYYLGAGNVWLPFDSVRVARWHDWEKAHADWRDHAIHNELYRHDAYGHDVPMRDQSGHDYSHGHDHDH